MQGRLPEAECVSPSDCSHFEYAGTMAPWRGLEAPEGAKGISCLPTENLSASAGTRLCPSLSNPPAPPPRPPSPMAILT